VTAPRATCGEPAGPPPGSGTVVGMDPVSTITEPVDRQLLALLRRAVLEHLAAEPRRVHPPVVHVGVPGAASTSLTLDQRLDQHLDHALRTDLLEAMVRRTPGDAAWPALVWLSRSGLRETCDVDLAWLAATRAAAAELGRALPMVVVTRRSWHDPATGVHRDWKRLRPR
jgi:hypothetical protein